MNSFDPRRAPDRTKWEWWRGVRLEPKPVESSPPSSVQKLILAVLCSRSGKTLSTFVSLKQVVEDSHVSERVAQRAFRALCAQGVLVEIPLCRGRHQTSTLRVLNMDGWLDDVIDDPEAVFERVQAVARERGIQIVPHGAAPSLSVLSQVDPPRQSDTPRQIDAPTPVRLTGVGASDRRGKEEEKEEEKEDTHTGSAEKDGGSSGAAEVCVSSGDPEDPPERHRPEATRIMKAMADRFPLVSAMKPDQKWDLLGRMTNLMDAGKTAAQIEGAFGAKVNEKTHSPYIVLRNLCVHMAENTACDVLAPERPAPKPWCGRCDRTTRMDVNDDDQSVPCPTCHGPGDS